MDWGLQNRISHIIKPNDNRALMLAVDHGAAGVDMGRNIWQSENPVPMIRAVRSIIHGNANVDEADELYKKFCQPKPKLPKAEK